jgi:hypothetical protein
MGLFGWFAGAPKSVHVDEDAVWMTPEAKLRGLCDNLEGQLPHSSLLLVVAHFPATLTQITGQVENYRFKPVVHDKALNASDIRRYADQSGAAPVVLVLAEKLTPEPASVSAQDDSQKPVTIVVGERHFLRGNDERILEFAQGLGRSCRLRFHLSLHDPLMQAIGATWVADMVASLGAKETDAIESRMITKRIQGAQIQFSKRALDDRKADSAEQWVELNGQK